MCGIAGIVYGDPQGDHAMRDMAKMMASIAHRGPDETGTDLVVVGRMLVGIGVNRLAMRDVRNGAQPWSLASGGYLAFNGEINDHLQLRERWLPHVGFRTNCDTETVARLWEELGSRCFDLLDGMFALAVVDESGIWLARDRHGIKPLYLSRLRSGPLVFASEIRAILQVVNQPSLDVDAIFENAIFGHPIRAKSYLSNIHTLEAGSVTHIDSGYGISSRRMADQDRSHRQTFRDSVVDVLEPAVCSALESEAPLGVFLSGGVDSSLVAGLAARNWRRIRGKEPLHTFTFADDREAGDVITARWLASAIGSRHHETMLDDAWVWHKGLVESITASEAPMANFGVLAAGGLGSRYVKGALVGEGADELFGGYALYREPWRWLGIMGRRYLEVKRWLGNDSPWLDGVRRELELLAASWDEVGDRVREFMLGDRLRELHLIPWDKLTMASSLEVRLPFLARDVVAFAESRARSSTYEDWVGKGPLKSVLRTALSEVFPEEVAVRIANRRKISGPENISRTVEVLKQRAARLVPAHHLDSHPFIKLLPHKADMIPLRVLLWDTYISVFVLNKGISGDVSVDRLYEGESYQDIKEVLQSLDIVTRESPLDVREAADMSFSR